jgi:hypothetical protein
MGFHPRPATFSNSSNILTLVDGGVKLESDQRNNG